MRSNVTRTLCAAAVLALVAGCSVKAKMSAGADSPPPAPEPAPAPAPAPTPAPAPEPAPAKVKAGAIELPSPIVFETGKATLKPESDAPLEVVKTYIESKPDITKWRIEGHTDTDGDDASNWILSQARAMTVSKWLANKGVACEKLIPVGFGESRLLVKDEATPEDKATNRRVMFLPAEVKGALVGGRPVDGGGKLAGNTCK